MTGRPGALETVTTAVAVALPDALVAVSTYVVVVDGETVVLPELVRLPNPWSMVTDVAFDTLQLRVDEPPAEMVAGAALKELIVGTPAGEGVPDTTTCTVTDAVLPAALVATSV
jgi:hypothetical protein